jgi:hypothetical protein
MRRVMKRIFALMLMAVCLRSALSGCIVVPDGDYHDHAHHYNNHDRY